MSGEAIVVGVAPMAAIVVAGPVILAGAAIAGTLVVGALAIKGVAAGVGAVIEHQAREAHRRAEEERARLAQWSAFELRQRQAMDDARERHEAIARVQQRLSAIQLREPGPALDPSMDLGTRANSEMAKHAEQTARRDAVATTLADIAIALDSVPDALRHHPASPLASLRQQVDRYQRRLDDAKQPLPDASQIDALKQIAQRSIADFLERLAFERDANASRIERADAALKLLLVLEQLPQPDQEPLRATRVELFQALEQNEISAAILDRIENRLQAASQQAAERLATGAVRPALAQALLDHLREMGYEVLRAFSVTPDGTIAEESAEARVRIPGGEQVAINLDADARLRFNLMHERAANHQAPLVQEEVDHLRTQEQRWCRDLKTLVGKLVADGFESRISFERPCSAVECTTIPAVVVEQFADDAGESASELDGRDLDDEARRRRIRQAEERKKRRLV
ncbi:exported hypothetical protein [Thiocapsa sp. KS1]|nr:hypothetical protein [Thiocapsa sp. KS1]CRI67732.1 exported hypothetical protein [Thiocapsa sp. KS1]